MKRLVFVALVVVRCVLGESAVSVYDIQFVKDPCASDWSPYLGKSVKLSEVYVTSVANSRFTISDSAKVAAWSGVVVDVPRLAPDLIQEGQRVTVSGRVMEIMGETRVVDVRELLVHAEYDPAAIVPADVTTESLSVTAECDQERWEGALVRATAAEILSDPDTTGSFIVDDGSGPGPRRAVL